MKLEWGLGLIAIGLSAFFSSARINRRSRRANGRIVRFEISTSKHFDDTSSSTSYIPVIAFRTPEGEEIECNGDSTPREPRVGAKVQLQYDPLHPTTAWERGSGNLWVLPFLITVVGVVLAIVGLRERSA